MMHRPLWLTLVERGARHRAVDEALDLPTLPVLFAETQSAVAMLEVGRAAGLDLGMLLDVVLDCVDVPLARRWAGAGHAAITCGSTEGARFAYERVLDELEHREITGDEGIAPGLIAARGTLVSEDARH